MRNLNSGKLLPFLALLLIALALPSLATAATVTKVIDADGFDRIIVLSSYDVDIVREWNFKSR